MNADYRRGFADGYNTARLSAEELLEDLEGTSLERPMQVKAPAPKRKTKRKLSDWNKYVKNKKNQIKLRNGKLNLKKMAVQFRKTRRK